MGWLLPPIAVAFAFLLFLTSIEIQNAEWAQKPTPIASPADRMEPTATHTIRSGAHATPVPCPDVCTPDIEAVWWPGYAETPTPTPTLPVRRPDVAAASAPGGCPQVILDVFGARAPAACRVSYCESTWNPNATGAAGEMGYFQVHPRWHADATYNELGNTLAAWRISSGGTDWSAWTCKP